MDSSRRFIIHIGTHKTGTTSIQKFLYINRLVFEKYGVYIPKAGVPGKYNGHHNLAWELHGETSFFKSKFGTFHDLKKELSEINHKTIVISSECFENFYGNADKLKKLKDFADDLGMKTYIYICFREEVEYIPMIYEELLKNGLTMDFNTFVNRVIESGKIDFNFERYGGGWDFCFDYNRIISGFSSIFGRESIKVFDFIPPVEIQFLKLLNIEDTKDFILQSKVGQPLPSFIVKALRPYNIMAERFEALNLIKRSGAPIISHILKISVALGLLSNVSSTIKLDSSQKESVINRFSFFTSGQD